MFSSRPLWAAVVVCLAACQSNNSVSFSKPKTPTAAAMQAVNGTGYSSTATFDAPVVDPSTWTGSPIGTGSFSALSAPAQSGGPQSIAAIDSTDPQQTVHYVIIGNLAGGPSAGSMFGIISLQPFVVGTTVVDSVNTFAAIFDGNSGDATALATSGSLTLTAVGARVVGSFSGTLEDTGSVTPPACAVDSDCARGEVCLASQCVQGPPAGCTSNAQCAAGQSCQAGQCVTNPNPGCTSNSQCSSPATCVSGQCVVQGICRLDSDCASGQACVGGQCVTGPITGACEGQGTGAYSGSTGAVATCSALGNGAVSLTQGMAAIGEDENGQLALYVVDPNSSSSGVVLPLGSCPSAAGTVSVTGAQVYSQSSAGPGLTLFAVREATGSIVFTQVGAHRAGSFTLGFTGGGSLSGTFDVQ